jgi:hypothetical protein
MQRPVRKGDHFCAVFAHPAADHPRASGRFIALIGPGVGHRRRDRGPDDENGVGQGVEQPESQVIQVMIGATPPDA